MIVIVAESLHKCRKPKQGEGRKGTTAVYRDDYTQYLPCKHNIILIQQ